MVKLFFLLTKLGASSPWWSFDKLRASGPLSVVSRAQGARRKAQGVRGKEPRGFASLEARGLRLEAGEA
jgi:hypothetical protein